MTPFCAWTGSFYGRVNRNIGGRMQVGAHNSGNLGQPDLLLATCMCGHSS